jgi:glutathione S-transferase
VPGRIGGGNDLLTELHAILFYLARTDPHARLLPDDPVGESRAIERMNWLASNVYARSYGQIWRAGRFVGDEADFAAVQDRGQENLRAQYSYIERLLADGREWALPGGLLDRRSVPGCFLSMGRTHRSADERQLSRLMPFD